MTVKLHSSQQQHCVHILQKGKQPQSMTEDSWLLPSTDLFSIRDTLHYGRAIFAKQDISPGMHLLSTTLNLSPLAHIIFRPYRREVCAQCFAYDRGREWKVRHISAGVVFCTEDCRTNWLTDHSGVQLDAYEAVESAVKRQQQSSKKASAFDRTSASNGDLTATLSPTQLQDYAQSQWTKAAQLGQTVKNVRTKSNPSKLDRRFIKSAVDLRPDPDVLFYLLTGVLAAYRSSMNLAPGLDQSSAAEKVLECVPSLLQLAPDQNVYVSTPTVQSSLRDYLDSYRQLLAILPLPLLEYTRADLCHELASRASHNAFSIRPADGSDGEQSGEFLGWGVWPEASFFNHSCQPNVRKERVGRQWKFWIEDGHAIKANDELCITYLGGDEKELNVDERRKRLKESWGFWCSCSRCESEAAASTTGRI